MTEVDDQNPDLGGAGEAVAPTAPATVPSGDPLDDIKDEAARAEAKKHRAIARRQGDKETPAPTPAPAPSGDVALTNKAVAKTLVSQEVRENWDELMSIPLGGYNANDPESIAENMTQRLAILKARPRKSDPAKDLTASPGIRGTTGNPPPSPTDKFKRKVVDLGSAFQ